MGSLVLSKAGLAGLELRQVRALGRSRAPGAQGQAGIEISGRIVPR